ncbi:MAG: RidA family protein [Rhodospirillaceae bacterium]|nr:RidA family protein [Rhodospirillaceae bacterium]
MLNTRNPETVAKPGGLYSHSVEVPPNARWLHIAGQVGVKVDGTMPESIEEQDEQMWQNTLLILEDAGFGVQDIVKLNVYSTDPKALPIHAKHRAAHLDDSHTPASTWVVISELANPKILIEMETVAAKAC